MIITEELWNSAASEFNNFRTDSWTLDHANRDRTLLYSKALLRKITGQEVFVVFPNALSSFLRVSKDKISQKKSNEFIKRMYEFFSDEEFLSRHNLVPAFHCIVPIMNDNESSEDCSVIEEESGEDQVEDLRNNDVYVNSDGSSLIPNVKTYITRPRFLFGDNLVAFLCHTNAGYLPTAILFTSDAAIEVTKIYNECNDIINEYCNTVSKSSGYYINIATILYSRLSFSHCRIELKNPIDPKEIYNEGLPESEIAEFIKSDVGGIGIFYGNPGCGKSTYIKYLATKYPNKEFNVISQDILLKNLSEVRNHLMTADKGSGSSIYIVEDCEKLLVSRESKENISTSVLSELLNMSDGILGDYLNIKFILTFNTKLPNIDKAILRKGRLRIKYEFTPLRGERLERLAEKLGIKLTEENIECGVSLADIFNYNNKIDFSNETDKKKIGF